MCAQMLLEVRHMSCDVRPSLRTNLCCMGQDALREMGYAAAHWAMQAIVCTCDCSPKEVERREAKWVELGFVAVLASAPTEAALGAIKRLTARLAATAKLALPLPPLTIAAKLFAET